MFHLDSNDSGMKLVARVSHRAEIYKACGFHKISYYSAMIAKRSNKRTNSNIYICLPSLQPSSVLLRQGIRATNLAK